MCLRATTGIKQLKDGMGWLVAIRKGGKPAKRQTIQVDDRLTRAECEIMQRRFAAGVDASELDALGRLLHLSVASLRKMEIGYDRERRRWTFPMRTGERKICGFRTRDTDGHKRSISGSRNGLFVPHAMDLCARYYLPFDCGSEVVPPSVLLLPEGPTDAAAALDLGFRAVGRPSNKGGAEMLRELLAAGEKLEVVIVADHDPVKWLKDGTPFVPGLEGALALAEAILPVCGVLRICRPPGDYKDLRQWKADGGDADVLQALIDESPVFTEKLLREKQRKLDDWKVAGRRARATKQLTPVGSPAGDGGSS